MATTLLAAASAATPPPSIVHPPLTFSDLLRHPRGFPLLSSADGGRLAPLQLWSQLQQIHQTAITDTQRERIQATIRARIKASLIRKHREVSRAVRAARPQLAKEPKRHRPPPTITDEDEGDHTYEEEEEDENDDDDEDDGGPTTPDDAEALQRVAVELMNPTVGTHSTNSSSTDTDILLDVIKLQLIDAPLVDVSSGGDLSVLSALSLGASGDDFALHTYALALTDHLMTRSTQLQAHLEQLMADKYWKDIRDSDTFQQLCCGPPPTEAEILLAAAANGPDQTIDASNTPPFQPTITKLVVAYLRKDDVVPRTSTPGDSGEVDSTGAAAAASSSSGPSIGSSWRRHTYYFDDFPTGVLLFGRSEQADVTVPDSGVSRTHGKMAWTIIDNDTNNSNNSSAPAANSSSSSTSPRPHSILTYTDLDSTYGSKLNGHPLTGSTRTAVLQVGSSLTIGKNCTIRILACDQHDQEKKKRRHKQQQQATQAKSDNKCAIQ